MGVSGRHAEWVCTFFRQTEWERGQRERGAASPSQGAHLSISLAQSIRLPGAAALPIFLWSEPTICTKLQAGVEGGRAAGGASERQARLYLLSGTLWLCSLDV